MVDFVAGAIAVLIVVGLIALAVKIVIWFVRITDDLDDIGRAKRLQNQCGPTYRHPVSNQNMMDPRLCDICQMTRRADNTCPGCDYQG